MRMLWFVVGCIGFLSAPVLIALAIPLNSLLLHQSLAVAAFVVGIVCLSSSPFMNGYLPARAERFLNHEEFIGW